jgi:hypothetical protein
MAKWKHILGGLTLGLGLAFFLLGGQTAGAQEQKPTTGLTAAAEIIALLGDVEIKPSGGVAFRQAQLKEPLNPGDQIRTLANSRAKLWFRDETVLILSENTTMQIDQFQTDEAGRPQKSRFKVLHGAMRFILSKIFAALPRSFEIEGTTAVMGVRGTDGIFRTSSPDTIYLLSGNPITLYDKATGQTITLGPMQYAVVEKGKPIRVGTITPQMLEQLIEEYRVAQLYIPVGAITPTVPTELLAYLYNFGNPLLRQTSSFRSLEGTSYIYQATLPTLHNATLPTIHNPVGGR